MAKNDTTLYLYELAWMLPSVALPVGMLAALLVTAFGAHIHLPGQTMTINPAQIDTTAPFDQPGIVEVGPGRYEARVAFHRSCHSRGTATGEAAIKLLTSVEGITVMPFGEAEQCCGFGGTFSVSFPNISRNMGVLKLEHIRATEPDILASVDMSCLMHVAGLAEKEGNPVRIIHVVQILRDALRNGGLLRS